MPSTPTSATPVPPVLRCDTTQALAPAFPSAHTGVLLSCTSTCGCAAVGQGQSPRQQKSAEPAVPAHSKHLKVHASQQSPTKASFPMVSCVFSSSSIKPRDHTPSNTQLNYQKFWRFIKNAVLLTVETRFLELSLHFLFKKAGVQISQEGGRLQHCPSLLPGAKHHHTHSHTHIHIHSPCSLPSIRN